MSSEISEQLTIDALQLLETEEPPNRDILIIEAAAQIIYPSAYQVYVDIGLVPIRGWERVLRYFGYQPKAPDFRPYPIASAANRLADLGLFEVIPAEERLGQNHSKPEFRIRKF